MRREQRRPNKAAFAFGSVLDMILVGTVGGIVPAVPTIPVCRVMPIVQMEEQKDI